MLFSAAILLTACEKTKTTENANSTNNDSIADNSDWKPVDSATATKAWMDYATPGEMQKMLAKADGNWTGETTMWMENGGQPMTSKSEANNKMMFDGPSRPGKDCNVREVFTFIDDNTQKMEMFGPDPKTGKEFKTMEIKFVRKK